MTEGKNEMGTYDFLSVRNFPFVSFRQEGIIRRFFQRRLPPLGLDIFVYEIVI
jgi:hypothetical protein